MGNVKLIGSFLILALAAASIYYAISISTEKPVYGRIGKPPLSVMIYAAAVAVAAVAGIAIVFHL